MSEATSAPRTIETATGQHDEHEWDAEVFRHAGAKAVLGRVLIEIGETDQATICLREALEAVPRDLPTLAGLCRAAPAEAESALIRLLEHDDNNDNMLALHHTLIGLLIGRGNFAAAARRIRDLTASRKANVDTGLLAMQAAVGAGNWIEATLLFDATAGHLPRNA